ncbi:cilia- and flagella-associated protein 337-like [Callospermophilus lateralis]|uniref:cilia- and flagella-associated protein 337-like n=1 Tax=Callospermophilus lateralis TaxID=76772 RepID=UPI004038FA7F
MVPIFGWGPHSILRPVGILGEPSVLRAHSCPAALRPGEEREWPGAQPPTWLLRACLRRQSMRSHSTGLEEGAGKKTPPRHTDLERRLRAEKGKSRSRKPRWATDVISMPQFNKLIVGTGHCELQLYELSNLEPYCQIGSLEAIPLKLDYWRKNLLLTGGLDQVIRVWNPHLPGKPTGLLRSHTAPVMYIHLSSEDNKIFSMSTDNTVKIWDLETHSCLFTASSKASGIQGELAACLYLPGPRALCVAADTVALLHLRMRSAPEPHLALSHQEPVVCCGYNSAFRHVVSCSEASIVKVWDFETGRQLSEFWGAHGNAGITCLTFDSSGRRLVTGGRDGCLKIWSYNNGHCLHTLKHDEKQSEVCDCTYMEVNQNKCIIAVGWDRRINVYFDAPCDFHHFWKPQPHWQDDLNNGHKEDILCVAQCPPFLLATSSYDGEIIIWNVISGHVYCKLNTPSPSDDPNHREGPDPSVSRLAFLKTRAARLDSVAASLIANGPGGPVTFWRLFGGAGLIANFTPSREKAQVSSIAVTTEDALAYLADQQGFVHVCDIKEYGLQGPELQPPKNVTFWRAHVSMVTCLELIEEENILLSSSLDHTVRLWSMDGAYIGTFGQSSPWDIFTPASWGHPQVPYEILTDPWSTPAHSVLEGDAPPGCTVGREEQDQVMEEKTCTEPERTSNLRTPEGSILEVEMKEDIHRWCALDHGRLLPAQNKPYQQVPEPAWPSIYQTLRCHEIACLSAPGEKPDLSIIGSEMSEVNFLMQEREGSGAAQKEHGSRGSFLV